MPDALHPRHPTRRVAAAAVLVALLAAAAHAQSPKPAAVRLPDGTVVLVTKNPDDPNAPVDGVVLSAKEYQGYVDQAEQLRKLKDAPKPAAPSECHVRARVEAAGGQPVAVLAVSYAFQTATPRAVVALGGQRGLPRSAKAAGGKLPVLGLTDDGLTVLVDQPGTHALAVEFEAPVSARGGGDLGFDVGLPRAAITTLTVDPPPAGKGLTVGTRTPDRPTEVRRAAYRPGAALGPTDLLDVSWSPPTPGPAADPGISAESEVAVRVDEGQVETTARVRLRGVTKEAALVFPAGADVSVERAGPPDPTAGPPTLTRLGDPKQPVWTLKVPSGSAAEWVVTATARQPRPRPSDPKHRGPYPVGPVAVPAAVRHTGTVRVFAPPTVRVGFKPGPDVRRQDLPAAAEDDLVALFRFAAGPLPSAKAAAPLMDLDARPAQGFVRVEPTYRLQLTRAGWRLTADLKVTPVRAEVDQFLVEMPDGWPGGEEASAPRRAAADGGPAELVDEVEVVKESGPRTLAVRFAAPQKSPFDLTLTAGIPVPAGVRELAVGLPRFPQAVEQNAKLTATVPDGLEVRGTATGRDGGQPGEPVDLKPTGAASGGAVTVVAAGFDKGAARADLAWQPYRPELTARVQAEITLGDRQTLVTETVTLRVADGGTWRPVRFRGPATAAGMRARDVSPVGPDEWELPAPPAGTREVTQTFVYALPLHRRTDKLEIGLFWPDAATRVDSTVRVWGGHGGRRLSRFDGPWRELPPDPDPSRDALPWLTLAGTGAGLPLALDLTDPADGPLPAVWVDRALIQAWVGDDVTAVRGRFLLRHAPAGGLDVAVPAGAVPEVVVEGVKSENLTPGTLPGTVRVPLPEVRAARGIVVDVRFKSPVGRAAWGDLAITPPDLPGAAYRSAVRWQALFLGGTPTVPLCVEPDFTPDTRWAWRDLRFAPTAGATASELDAWFAAESDGDAGPSAADADPDALTGRQPSPAAVTVFRVPRAGWVAACSVLALLLTLGLSLLRPELLGPAVALVGVGVAAASVAYPQPAAQAAGGAQPGLWLAAGLLGLQAGWRWYHRRRITHLPGFTRARPDSGVNGVPSAGTGTGSNMVPLNEPVPGTSNPTGR